MLKSKSTGNKLALFIASSLLLVSSTSLLAQNSNIELYDEERAEQERISQEQKGLLGGALIGGLIAGPPGAIIVAAFGAITSNQHSTEKQNTQLQASLAQKQSQLYALQEKQKSLQNLYELAVLEKQTLELVDLNASQNNNLQCCTDSALALHFRSNSAALELHYRPQIESLARLANSIPDSIIEINAYTDRRGESAINLELSQRRINTVERSLLSLGIKKQNIISAAYGERYPLSAQETLEGNFFDRRVTVKLRENKNELITQTK